MAAPQQKRVASVKVEEVKERDVLDVYRSILDKATEMYVISLGIESSEELASLLKAVEVVQVQLSVIIGKIQEERAIAKSVKEYEERGVKDEEG